MTNLTTFSFIFNVRGIKGLYWSRKGVFSVRDQLPSLLEKYDTDVLSTSTDGDG